jgi:CheY-like chemotaxis protein
MRPDLVLMDVGLPDKNGIAYTEQIKTLDGGKQMPTMLIIDSKDGLQNQAPRPGCDCIVGKPAEYRPILRVTSDLLET